MLFLFFPGWLLQAIVRQMVGVRWNYAAMLINVFSFMRVSWEA